MSTYSVDPMDVIPKYFQLVNILRHKIEDGDWSPYTPIPSERQLEKIYHLSRTTIREAIGILIRQGYLYREQGRGTFVSPQKLQKAMPELTSFSEDMKKRGLKPGQEVLNVGFVPAPTKILEKLEQPAETEQILCVERLRLADDKPIAIQISYLVLPDGECITDQEMESTQSLYRLLIEKFNIVATEAEETLEATLASKEEAALLQIPEGSPLLLNSRTTLGLDRRPFEYVKVLYRGDRYRYIFRVTR